MNDQIKIISRQDAISGGQTRYFTGKPCKYGHVAERMVSTRACLECKSEREKRRSKRVLTEEQRRRKTEGQIKRRKENPDLHRAWGRKSYYKNQDKNIKRSTEYKIKRLKTDKFFLFKKRVRSLVTQSLKNHGYSKKSKTCEIIGCSFEDFKLHIEKQFQEGMSWENRHLWHIDHRVPLASANTEEEIIKLNHFTNLQPMWAEDNLKKGAREEYLI